MTGQILFPIPLFVGRRKSRRVTTARNALSNDGEPREAAPIANIFAVSAGRPLFSVTIAELRHKLKQKSQGPRPFVVASACAARAGLQGPASSSPAKLQRAFLLRFLLPPV